MREILETPDLCLLQKITKKPGQRIHIDVPALDAFGMARWLLSSGFQSPSISAASRLAESEIIIVRDIDYSK